MRLLIASLFSCFFLLSCNKDENKTSIKVFNANSFANEALLEINGDVKEDPVKYGELSTNFPVKIGENIINLLPSGGDGDVLASFKGEIDPKNKSYLFFTGSNDSLQTNSFLVANSNLPDTSPGSVQIRFVQASAIPDTVTFLSIPNGNSNEERKPIAKKMLFSETSEFISQSVSISEGTTYTIKALAGGSDLATSNFLLQNQEVVTFVFMGSGSVINPYDFTAISHN